MSRKRLETHLDDAINTKSENANLGRFHPVCGYPLIEHHSMNSSDMAITNEQPTGTHPRCSCCFDSWYARNLLHLKVLKVFNQIHEIEELRWR
jgi:hypothetical protein